MAKHKPAAVVGGVPEKPLSKHWHNIATALQSHPPMTLRVNRRHGNAESYLEKLARKVLRLRRWTNMR